MDDAAFQDSSVTWGRLAPPAHTRFSGMTPMRALYIFIVSG